MKRNARRTTSRKMGIESLEGRRLLAADSFLDFESKGEPVAEVSSVEENKSSLSKTHPDSKSIVWQDITEI